MSHIELGQVRVLQDTRKSDGTIFKQGDLCFIRSIRKSLETKEVHSYLVRRACDQESYLLLVHEVELVT